MQEELRAITRERMEGFQKVLKAVKGRFLIICHNFPDPDCIAAAFGLRAFLAEACQREADLYSGTGIGRSENRAFAGLLGIEFVEPDEVRDKNYAAAIYVDTQPKAGNNILPAKMPVIAVFDHHESPESPYNTAWKDVRSEGCTSTMMCQYLDAAGVTFSTPLATALFIGIRTDTADLERDYSAQDVYWYEQLLPKIDRGILSRVVHPKLPEAYYTLLYKALDAVKRYDDVVICAPGVLPAPDLLCEVSELFLRLKGVNWSLAVGIYENRVYLSLRAAMGRKASISLLNQCVPEDARVGGHGQSAGGVVFFSDTENLEEKAFAICARFTEVMNVAHAGPRPITMVPGTN